jgi:Flp pilus assembly protein TadG
MRARRRRERGQSFVELAVTLPILLLIALGATDLARGYYLSDEITGAARAGMRAGIKADTIDIGDAVRSEPNTAIANSVAVWGREGPPSGGVAQSYADCSGPATPCGDPNGCTGVSSWQSGQIACFAVRSCTLTNTSGNLYTCAPGSFSAWQLRPRPCNPFCVSGQQGPNGDGLDVLVVYRFQPQTLLITRYVTGGTFLLRSETLGLELYY